MGQVPIPVSVQCEQCNIIYTIVPIVCPVAIPGPCSVQCECAKLGALSPTVSPPSPDTSAAYERLIVQNSRLEHRYLNEAFFWTIWLYISTLQIAAVYAHIDLWFVRILWTRSTPNWYFWLSLAAFFISLFSVKLTIAFISDLCSVCLHGR